jgi:hypothetical protein
VTMSSDGSRLGAGARSICAFVVNDSLIGEGLATAAEDRPAGRGVNRQRLMSFEAKSDQVGVEPVGLARDFVIEPYAAIAGDLPRGAGDAMLAPAMVG